MMVTRTGPAPGASGARSVPGADPGGEYRLPNPIRLPATAIPLLGVRGGRTLGGDYVAEPPGHECPGYAATEKPGEPGSWRNGSDFGAGFSRLFVSHVARAFMPGRGRRSQSDKVELILQQPLLPHPLLVELREIPLPGVREEGDHQAVRAQPLGHLAGAGHGGAAGGAGEDRLPPRQLHGGPVGGLVVDRHDLVDVVPPDGRRHEVLADAVD